MSWLYRNEENNLPQFIESIAEFPNNCFGFIYVIRNLTNDKFYIGKKQIQHKIKRKITKKELKLIEGQGRRPTKKLVVKESDWQSYWGSSKQLLEDIEKLGEKKFQREILKFCRNKKQLSYYEVFYQFKFDVLNNENCYNQSILGKYFKKDI